MTSEALTSERLIIEPLVEEHAAKLFAALQDEALYRFVPQDPPDSVAPVAAQYKKWERRQSPDGTEQWLNWALFSRHHGAYVGTAQATVRADKSAMLAYTIFSAFQGQGFATEACRTIIARVGIKRAEAFIDTRNTASQRVVERLGMRVAERIANADYFKGAESDEFRYEMVTEGMTSRRQVAIRRATPADRQGIARAHVAAIRGLATPHYSAEQIAAWSSGKDPENYPVESEMMFVAVVGTDVVAFGELHLGSGEVRAVYVSPEAANQGVGSRVLATLEGVARDHGLTRLTLAASLNAVSFYERRGFMKIREDKKLLLGTTLLPYVSMEKSLPRTSD